jgi:hypothetical protein
MSRQNGDRKAVFAYQRRFVVLWRRTDEGDGWMINWYVQTKKLIRALAQTSVDTQNRPLMDS